jgi:ABC-type proline/glycine betaine transport system ATPase subunit
MSAYILPTIALVASLVALSFNIAVLRDMRRRDRERREREDRELLERLSARSRDLMPWEPPA